MIEGYGIPLEKARVQLRKGTPGFAVLVMLQSSLFKK